MGKKPSSIDFYRRRPLTDLQREGLTDLQWMNEGSWVKSVSGSLERTRELGVRKGVLPFPLAAASSRARQNWIWHPIGLPLGGQEKGNDVNENYLLRADSSIWVE
ncbi:hypothetical protein CJ030_MR6G025960 [Morella rubra]|uniref:Uncharacterized protein n=1 Tax=Morella rubra TaxID=262757 RepID=A0A6A1VA94_9ROSI|nr:hypothetical protein CJ030_MR6G025960 [Morella rubra]